MESLWLQDEGVENVYLTLENMQKLEQSVSGERVNAFNTSQEEVIGESQIITSEISSLHNQTRLLRLIVLIKIRN